MYVRSEPGIKSSISSPGFPLCPTWSKTGTSVAGPVKPGPCDTAEGGIAVDAPVAVPSDGLDDVESVGSVISGVMAGPDVALVLDFEPYVGAGAYCGADDELATRLARSAMGDRVRRQFGCHEDRLVGNGAFAQDGT